MFDPAEIRTACHKPCGVGYKPQHFADIMEDPRRGQVGWKSTQKTTWAMGGRPLGADCVIWPNAFPISVHGVGLSIGGEGDRLIQTILRA